MAEEKKKDLSQMTEEEIDNLKYQSDNKEETKEEVKEEPKKEEETKKDSETKKEPKEEKQKSVSDMTKEEIEELKYKSEQDKQQVLNKVIRGYNDSFVKHYDFDEFDLSFTIRLHLPNMIEQGKINALRSSYLGGTDTDQPAFIFYAFEMLATIQIVGDDVPKEFKNETDIYNPAPLVTMYQDWMDFQSTFRY